MHVNYKGKLFISKITKFESERLCINVEFYLPKLEKNAFNYLEYAQGKFSKKSNKPSTYFTIECKLEHVTSKFQYLFKKRNVKVFSFFSC